MPPFSQPSADSFPRLRGASKCIQLKYFVCFFSFPMQMGKVVAVGDRMGAKIKA